MLRWILCSCLLLALSISPVFAQGEVAGATLNGTITDATGAAVPGATVTVTNRDTGLTRTTTSNEAGQYTFPRVPVLLITMTVAPSGITERTTPRMRWITCW